MVKKKVANSQNNNQLMVTSDGAFFTSGEYRKIYHIGKKEQTFHPQEVMKSLNSNIQVTKRIGKEKNEVYVVLILEGDYDTVQEKFLQDEEVLKTVFEIRALNGKEVMDSIYGNHKGLISNTQFNKKEDWKSKCLPVLECKDDYFFMNGMCGEAFYVMDFPETLSSGICKALRKLESEILISTDIANISESEMNDYNRAMEEKYHRRIGAVTDTNYFNVSQQIVILGDSEEARRIIEHTLLTIYNNNDFMVSVATGNQKEMAWSVFSFGLVPVTNKRTVEGSLVDSILGKEELW